MRRLALAALAGTLVLAGCARERQPVPPQRPPSPEVPARPPAPAPSAAEFVSRAGSIDLLAIRASELALARSRDDRVREFARQMLRDHRGTSGQLSLAGRRLNLLPSVNLLADHEAMMRQLGQSPDFDSLYWRLQARLHREASDLHARYAARGQSPTLKPVATAALAVERRHLQQLPTR